MSEKKELNIDELEKANGGGHYSPPEYDDDYDDDYANFRSPGEPDNK